VYCRKKGQKAERETSIVHGKNHAGQLIPSARLPCAMQTATDSVEQNRVERSENTAHEALLNQPHSPVFGNLLELIVACPAPSHSHTSRGSTHLLAIITPSHSLPPFTIFNHPPLPPFIIPSSSSPPLGTITGLRNYGAFLELDGGMAGLLHISQISYERVDSLETLFTIGQRCKVRYRTA
jgi:S1 RNA binding domain